MREEDAFTIEEYKKITIVTAGLVLLLLIITIGSYLHAKGRNGTTVLPGGITYLGPSPSPIINLTQNTYIPIPSDSKWATYNGKLFPYSFQYPTALSLGVFPNDPFDGVTIFWGNTNPQENIFLRVEDLQKLPDMAKFIGKSKKGYADIWWKQYSWKGVSSVDEFTNAKGVKGYRAKYVNDKGQIPFDNIFFEIPGKSNLVVWMGNKIIDPITFDKIIDSFTWN